MRRATPGRSPELDGLPNGEQRVTALELLFDLVVVFVITQVTKRMSADLI